MKGHITDTKDIKYKEGDEEKFIIPAQSTDKIMLFGSNGRFYTIGAEKLPSGRGFGEPVRLMIDLPQEHEIINLSVHDPARELLLVSNDGRGFLVKEEDVLAQTKNGKQVLNIPEGGKAIVCTPATGDNIAIIGENRKLLIFPKSEVPQMTKGRGVILQKYKDGGASDAVCFKLADGLAWTKAGKEFKETNLRDWVGKRAQAGRLPPRGFPQSNKFNDR
jgi:topoisomerase-4 subunit A